VCRCDFWKNEKRERKTIQTTHQFIFLLVLVLVFVCRVCVNDTTATGQTLLFLSLALSPKERERVYFYSRVVMRREFFCRFREINSSKGKVMCSKIPPLFVSNTPLLLLVTSKNCLISQILLPFNSSKPLQSLLRLNRQVSRGARRSSSSASSFAERERTLLEILLKKRDSH